MKKLKMPSSISFQAHLISSLTENEHIAAYISATLEEKEPEAELLRAVIQDIIDARSQINNLSESAKLYHKKLDRMLLVDGGSEIYTLVDLLDSLGLQLEIKVKDNHH